MEKGMEIKISCSPIREPCDSIYMKFQNRQSSDSHLGVILPIRGHWAMSGDICGCHNSGCSWHRVGRDQKGCSAFAVPRMAPQKSDAVAGKPYLACLQLFSVLQMFGSSFKQTSPGQWDRAKLHTGRSMVSTQVQPPWALGAMGLGG